MAKFINPLTDIGFKRIFGDKEIMMSFLNSLFEGEFVIKDIEYLDKEQEALPGDERNIIYDLFCKTDTDMEFIVEMQSRSQLFYRDRIIYYLSRVIAGQGMKGDKWNYKLTPIYGIYWMNFSLSEDGQVINDISLYSKHQLKEGVNAKPFTDKVRAITIDMRAFNKIQANCETTLDQWIYNIKNMESMTTMPFKESNNVFAHLETLSDYYAMDIEDRKIYDAALRRNRDYYATLESARVEGLEEGRAEGRAEGIEEGRAEGRAEGFKDGEEKGRSAGIKEGERKTNIFNAKKFKELGVDIFVISQATGLTIEEINKL